jgi:general secretion pathway protein J
MTIAQHRVGKLGEGRQRWCRAGGASARSGMTLVEVLAAMAVFGMVATVVYSGVAQTIRQKQIVESDLDRYHEIVMGLGRMAREISSAYVSAQAYSNPNRALWVVQTAFHGREEGRDSRLDFTSFSHRRLYRDTHESDQNELSYFVAQSPEDRSRSALARREQRRIDDKPEEGGQIQVLIDNVTEFKLTYLDSLTGEWLSTWDASPAGTQPNRMPSQVQISVTVPNIRGKGREQTFGTRAYVPIRFGLNHAIYQ